MQYSFAILVQYYCNIHELAAHAALCLVEPFTPQKRLTPRLTPGEIGVILVQ